MCEKRLKSVGFFAFSDLYSKDSENMYVAARSLKKINDDSVVLSNLLCIKKANPTFREKDLIEFPLGAPVYTADGKALGVLSDLYFGDTDKIATAIIVNETPVLVERIASVDAQGVILLPDGKKSACGNKKSKPVIEKPEKDFKVSILSPPENALSLPVKALSNYGFLIGRVATSSVYDRNNVPIVKKGALVTKKVVFDAHRKNRLIALTLATCR
ncbi:MAG: PRC-barrel domain-containing protein [Clostridiales bacterium]|nr:MAG: PRC-barrel domain-containing protein [Clostridiales bacterium]